MSGRVGKNAPKEPTAVRARRGDYDIGHVYLPPICRSRIGSHAEVAGTNAPTLPWVILDQRYDAATALIHHAVRSCLTSFDAGSVPWWVIVVCAKELPLAGNQPPIPVSQRGISQDVQRFPPRDHVETGGAISTMARGQHLHCPDRRETPPRMEFPVNSLITSKWENRADNAARCSRPRIHPARRLYHAIWQGPDMNRTDSSGTVIALRS